MITAKSSLKKFEHDLLNTYYKNNHLPMGLKFIQNANSQVLTVLIKAYGILINPVWIKMLKINYGKTNDKYIVTKVDTNHHVVNTDENITINNYIDTIKKAQFNRPIMISNSSDELTTDYHND